MESLDPRARVVWVVFELVIGAVVGLGGTWLVDRFVFEIAFWVGPVAAAVLALAGAGYALLRYRVWRFEVQEDAVYLERGVFTRVESVVPFVRIQNVDTKRGPVERLAGLSSVVVYTAGTRGADATLPGLAPERATALREELRELAVESEYEDAL
ncbi:PH domain-containing protein [Halococcus hamelinensis]|nr:PH domain-containing protein [Halococcus hamelinensis]